MELLFVLLLALAMDVLFGEPPRATHPVVWIGKVISFWERFAPAQGPRSQLVYGGGVVVLTIFIFAAPVYFLLIYASQISSIAYVIGGALLLKLSFSLRELRRAALAIELILTKDNLREAQAMMSTLVSRDTQSLEKPEIVSATVESVAENVSDSFVAPLFYFLLLGVPGAVAYRVVNTFDAMIGYHGKYEYLGKFAARLDDVLNFIPARVSGLLLVIAAYLCKRDGKRAWRVMLRDHGKTESPNAGWPMSAMAGALRVRLEKRGCYTLGNTNNPLSPQVILSGMKLVEVAALLWVSVCLIVGVTYFVLIA
ncbi:MAG: cobalamin biosynthesis protein [Chloroflexi bacterium]|nr:cobalamin biosynthesis protein [Chloroflexota bacterium]